MPIDIELSDWLECSAVGTLRIPLSIAVVAVALVAIPCALAANVPLQQATADFSQTSFLVTAAIDGNTSNTNGWAIHPQEGQNHTAVFETQLDTGFLGGTLFTFTFQQLLGTAQHTMGRFRISITTDDRSTFADGLTSGGDVTANWTVLDPITFTSSGGATLTKQPDMSILASGTSPNQDTYTVTALTGLTGITGIRIELMTDPSLPFNGPGRQPLNGNFVLTEMSIDAVASPVPEPSSTALFGAATLIAAGYLIRRRSVRARA